MPRTTDAREKVLATAERLFRTQGFAATGLAEILESSGAPRGSYYHHFPNGKTQMGQEALERYGARAEALIAHGAAKSAGDAAAFVRFLAGAFAQEMRASEWKLGCMLQNFAAELAPADEAWAARLAEIGLRWRKALAVPFANAGMTPRDAEALAAVLLAALTGARTMARIARSTQPFDQVTEAFEKIISLHAENDRARRDARHRDSPGKSGGRS